MPSSTPTVAVVGAGPAGLTAAIAAARRGARVAVFEAGPAPGRKLLASGGGRCNLTNTLPVDAFMARFAGHGRFMQPALARLGPGQLRAFLAELGVATHAPDGRRVFPTDHRARTVLDGLRAELARLQVELHLATPVVGLDVQADRIRGVLRPDGPWPAAAVVLACGGCGYPALGGSLAGCELAAACSHRLVAPHPGMVPLRTRESWPARCTADTVPRARLSLRRSGRRGLAAVGDLIFTRDGLAGPVVLDLAREVTPLLDAEGALTLALELTPDDQDTWRGRLQAARAAAPARRLADWLTDEGELGRALAGVLSELAGTDPDGPLERVGQPAMSRLAAVLARVEVTLVGHGGWDQAMVMRGGVSLRDVRPESLQSRRIRGLYLAGEMLDLDGPCGGFNLQWAFASGHLAGTSAAGG
ncbi:MAG: aminoacetone oxidase family FAD-binding enzyme [Candidatus Krumholzibacteriia bacterium]